MDASSSLCLDLISSAFQRCRVSEDICRLSVSLKSPPPLGSPITQISISDTGIGSNLEEFQYLKCTKEAIDTQKWDGLLSVTNTSICDSEVYNYLLNLRESIASRRLTRLPSNPKNGSEFSGTQVCLSIVESVDVLESVIVCFFQKILILKIPNVAVELVVECLDIPGLRRVNVFLANESNPLPLSTSNDERLMSGLQDYVLKHGNILNQNCNSCFRTREQLKIGNGMACNLENQRGSGLTMEVVIIISESALTCPCFSQCFSKTEVLYFEDFKPCSISNQFLNALSSIDWKSYGMTLGNVGDQEGNLLVWENLPPNTHIAIALHSYHKQVIISSARRKTRTDRYLMKRAVKLALDDLKEKYAGMLLSEHALKIRSYAPDFARSIAGLILLSNDPDFQEECYSLLGLQTREIEQEIVKDCIKEKIISIIDTNDRKSRGSKEMATAPFLFEDDCCWNSNFQDNEYEGEDESGYAFNYLD
ncbi:type 2 DNA topoisomerase 6 subunit B-like isoform X1 [Ricinus communis]|uniref:type 2 DNA topoisomerase 6 subunit B-like isoform X1 n=1 Tax=Ricinus communis TaxID=3988 RepID=UPI0007728FA4|nr:type 2 DNA topoisomerase 6 subunit B-like isoform X1 [Ricinus communis]|eukprot:XP_015578627.1 type 2 DNA topoisomerase 6 subunit B-like [Ricinus communis]